MRLIDDLATDRFLFFFPRFLKKRIEDYNLISFLLLKVGISPIKRSY